MDGTINNRQTMDRQTIDGWIAIEGQGIEGFLSLSRDSVSLVVFSAVATVMLVLLLFSVGLTALWMHVWFWPHASETLGHKYHLETAISATNALVGHMHGPLLFLGYCFVAAIVLIWHFISSTEHQRENTLKSWVFNIRLRYQNRVCSQWEAHRVLFEPV